MTNTTALHEADYLAPLGNTVLVTPRCGLTPAVTPCGPCCSLDRDGIWNEVLLGVHKSVLDELTTADYWVSVHRYENCLETGHSFVEEECIIRLTVGASVGARRPKIENYVEEHFPGGVIHDYCLWGDWPEFRDEFEQPF